MSDNAFCAWITLLYSAASIVFIMLYKRDMVPRWKSAPPMECGWWWAKDRNGIVEVVEVDRSGNVRDAGDFIVTLPSDPSYRLLSSMIEDEYRWSGPISQPRDPL